ncbi:anthocyanin 3'-O-beta-glucosyltransferase-like [Wolffia australiana]
MEMPAESPFRVFFIPFFVPSHMNPMVDLACAFAMQGVDVTILLTPANERLIKSTIDRTAATGLSIRSLCFPFPSEEVGLPEGVESLSTVSRGEEEKIYLALDAVNGSIGGLLRLHRPSVVVHDFLFAAVSSMVKELGIPCVVFHGFGAFPLVILTQIESLLADVSKISNEGINVPFLVRGVPDKVEMVESELPDFYRTRHYLNENLHKFNQSLEDCNAEVVNTIYDIEPAYCDLYSQMAIKPVFFLRPFTLGLINENGSSSKKEISAWLDMQARGSVVYVSFGSFNYISREQCRELALGLELSGRPFLWALKERDFAGDGENLLPEGFESRVQGRGLVCKGWVPQKAILGHLATGAFITHMGWNSLIEALVAGVPMISWPLSYEQFVNERFVTCVLSVGLRMWDGYRSSLPEEAAKAVVKAEDIARVVGRFLPPGCGDDEIEALRERAARYQPLIQTTVEEDGVVWKDLTKLINALKAYVPGDDDLG